MSKIAKNEEVPQNEDQFDVLREPESNKMAELTLYCSGFYKPVMIISLHTNQMF